MSAKTRSSNAASRLTTQLTSAVGITSRAEAIGQQDCQNWPLDGKLGTRVGSDDFEIGMQPVGVTDHALQV